jgi:predicted nucleic acid-binding Zn ribbon protein
MKIRLGFVSNSSSTCFVCGTWCDGDEDICDDCRKNRRDQNADAFYKWLCIRLQLNAESAQNLKNLFDEYRKIGEVT